MSPPADAAASPPPSAPPVSPWGLPTGIETHLEAFAIKACVGLTVGAAAGVVLFSKGRGWRVAAAASGLGVAVGSSAERFRPSGQGGWERGLKNIGFPRFS